MGVEAKIEDSGGRQGLGKRHGLDSNFADNIPGKPTCLYLSHCKPLIAWLVSLNFVHWAWPFAFS